MTHLFEEIKTVLKIKFFSDGSSISITIHGSSVGRKKTITNSYVFLSTDGTSIAVELIIYCIIWVIYWKQN